MKRFVLIMLVALFSFGLLVACGEKKEEVRTVEWYTENPEKREARLKICNNNPGELRDNPNCVNARKSKLADSFGDARTKKFGDAAKEILENVEKAKE